jgi:uncharacterized repeat protein (TIGR01451 family)
MRVTKLTFFFLIATVFAVQAFALSGAIYTTTADCSGVDANRYLWKDDVYLNGGPQNSNSAGFTPGNYYVQVTTPQGVVLGRSSSAVVTVGSDGRFISCYHLSDILQRASNPSLSGYDTSPTGAEYKVWVSETSSFNESESKTDNFRVDNPHISVQKICTPDAFVNDTFTSTITVTNTGSCPLTNVTVTDSVAGGLGLPDEYLDTLPFGGSYTWTVAASSSDAGPFAWSVTASGADDFFSYTANDSAHCATNVWALAVTKTASTSYTRDWNWSLTKTANPNATITIMHGSLTNIGYAVIAKPTAVDSAWKVTGSVKVHNPAPIAATVSSLVDVLSDSTPVALQCSGSAPYTVAGGGDLICSYSVARSSAAAGSNTATATLANNNGLTTTFDGSASYSFGAPSTVLHTLVTVTDSGVTVDSPGWSFTSSPASYLFAAPAGGSFAFNVMAGNVSAACDSYAIVSNTAFLNDGDHTLQASASHQLYAGACGNNCTLTIGYWKTHAGFTGRNADRVTPELPQRLGTLGGLKTVNVTNAPQAVTLLSNSGDASNGVNKLYSQMLAAKLNIFRGASPAAINTILSAADTFLATNNSADWNAMNKNAKQQVNNWASTFDQYNNGEIGPGHCD